jgi:hypothetical protein
VPECAGRFHEILRLETPPLAVGRKAGFSEGVCNSQLIAMPNPLDEKKPSLGEQGGGSAPPEGGVKAPSSESSSALRAPGRSSGAPATGEFTIP